MKQILKFIFKNDNWLTSALCVSGLIILINILILLLIEYILIGDRLTPEYDTKLSAASGQAMAIQLLICWVYYGNRKKKKNTL